MNCYRVALRSSAGPRLSIIVAAEAEEDAIERAETLGKDLLRRKRPPWYMEEGRTRPTRGDPIPVVVVVTGTTLLHPNSLRHAP